MAEFSLIKKILLGLATGAVIWLNINIYKATKIDEDTEFLFTSLVVKDWEKELSPDKENDGFRYVITSAEDKEYMIDSDVSICLDQEYFDFIRAEEVISIGQLNDQGVLGWFYDDQQVYQVISENRALIDLECAEDRNKQLKWLVPLISALTIFILFTILRRQKKKLS